MPSKLSILLPTYNGSVFCDQQIESILNQSFRDFELLIVDDGSSDDTWGRVVQAAGRDGRIRLLPRDRENRGQKIRLLELLRRAEGELIGFSDQDDIWEPQKLERLIDGLGDAGLAFGPSQLIDEAGRPIGETVHSALGVAIRPGDRLLSLAQPLVSAHGMIVRRELVSDIAFCESAPFDWLIGLDAQYTAGVRYVEDAVTMHRVHRANQNNGDILNARGALHWRARLLFPRNLIPSGHLDRFSFWRRAVHLANSPMLAPHVRRAFTRVCRACEEAWFEKQGPYRQSHNRRCREVLLEQLEPFAGSPEDWRDCQQMIALLTSNWRTRVSRHMFQ